MFANQVLNWAILSNSQHFVHCTSKFSNKKTWSQRGWEVMAVERNIHFCLAYVLGTSLMAGNNQIFKILSFSSVWRINGPKVPFTRPKLQERQPRKKECTFSPFWHSDNASRKQAVDNFLFDKFVWYILACRVYFKLANLECSTIYEIAKTPKFF